MIIREEIYKTSQEVQDQHVLNEFFGLLYKIDLRNKREKRVKGEELNKNKEPQIKK